MTLKALLIEKRSAILENWFQAILDTYPPGSVRFFGQKKDQFQNPVGHTISREIEVLYDELLGELEPQKLVPSLEKIMKIRSVQEFSPSQAVGIIFLLKEAVRQVLTDGHNDNRLHDELLEFNRRIDRLVMLAFDVYMMCREKIFDIRMREAKDGTSRLMDRLNMTQKKPDEA